MQPFKYDNDVAYFYKSQLDLFGTPDQFGFTHYMVIDDTECPLVCDYDLEQERYGRVRPIHRYNRIERFICILGQLCGYRGEISDSVLVSIVNSVEEPYTWESIRKAMKESGYTKLYNRIPYVLQYLKSRTWTSSHQIPNKKLLDGVTDQIYQRVIREFARIQTSFNENKNMTDRKYFPSLRFIALKLLQRHGVMIHIPLMRNKKTLDKMEDLWLLLELV